MPNGSEYNHEWCVDKHKKIDQEFKNVWQKFKDIDKIVIGIFMVLIGNLGGVIATLIMLVK